MKRIEKLKLNEMQDFTVIEKKESTALKGGNGAWMANIDGWVHFLQRYYNDQSIDENDVLTGTPIYYNGEAYAITAGLAGQQACALGSCGSGGSHWYLVDLPGGGIDYQYYEGSAFGEYDNVQYLNA